MRQINPQTQLKGKSRHGLEGTFKSFTFIILTCIPQYLQDSDKGLISLIIKEII